MLPVTVRIMICESDISCYRLLLPPTLHCLSQRFSSAPVENYCARRQQRLIWKADLAAKTKRPAPQWANMGQLISMYPHRHSLLTIVKLVTIMPSAQLLVFVCLGYDVKSWLIGETSLPKMILTYSVEIPALTARCSEIGSLTSMEACSSGASRDVREPISLHQAV